MKYTNEQDIEDYEQEKKIRALFPDFDCQYINRNGNVRTSTRANTTSLDETFENGKGSLHDIIKSPDRGNRQHRKTCGIKTLLNTVFDKETTKWIIRLSQFRPINERTL